MSFVVYLIGAHSHVKGAMNHFTLTVKGFAVVLLLLLTASLLHAQNLQMIDNGTTL